MHAGAGRDVDVSYRDGRVGAVGRTDCQKASYQALLGPAVKVSVTLKVSGTKASGQTSKYVPRPRKNSKEQNAVAVLSIRVGADMFFRHAHPKP